MRMANVCTPRLARFALCSLPGWLQTLSDGADVTVMPKSSRAAALRWGKRFSLFQ